MSKSQTLMKGTLILTMTGIATRFIGFFYRIFLSHTFGEEMVGIYQLIFPIYALFISITCAGIQTAVSRFVARSSVTQAPGDSKRYFTAGLTVSFLLSFLCMIFLRSAAPWIAASIIGDVRCEPLLEAMAYAFPFSAIHSSICGYYFGRRQTRVPSISQLFEQFARVTVVFLLVKAVSKSQTPPSISFAVLGLVSGEIASSFYSVVRFLKDQRTIGRLPVSKRSNLSLLGDLLKLSLPITANRILLNLLQSVEAVSIPHCLRMYGCTSAEALATYGVLTGMALPCILFPSAATNSIATMLMPSVAELQASGNTQSLRKITSRVIAFCLFTGILCCTVFLLFGNFIGTTLFHSDFAGKFIITLAWMCPFLYMNTALLSILNGLGKTSTTLVINTAGLTIRILSVFLIIPAVGIIGYLWGMLASQIVITFGCFFIFRREIR